MAEIFSCMKSRALKFDRGKGTSPKDERWLLVLRVLLRPSAALSMAPSSSFWGGFKVNVAEVALDCLEEQPAFLSLC